MKAWIPLLAMFVASGCKWDVRSPDPFYTPATRTAAPELRGEWLTGDTCWILTGELTMSLRSYEETGPRDVPVVPFQVVGMKFVDILGGGLHTVYRLEASNRFVTLTALSGDWLTNAIATGKAQLPAAQKDAQSNVIFAATSQQWINFLEQHATNDAIYGNALILKRSPNGNFIPARRQQP